MSKNDEFKRGHSPLTDQDRAVLDFEAKSFKSIHHKSEAIFNTFGHTATRHYQKVNSLLDNPAALEHNPALINRLRRQRDQRRKNRSAKQLGMQL